MNTNERLFVKATIDDRSGEHRGDNPYYAFDFGPIDGNKQIIFTFEMMETLMLFICGIVNIKKLNDFGVRIGLNFNVEFCFINVNNKIENSLNYLLMHHSVLLKHRLFRGD